MIAQPAAPSRFQWALRELSANPFGSIHDSITNQYPDTLQSFITDTLGESLWSKQRDICDALDQYRFVAVRSAHACGKSFTAARVALAYLHTHPNSVVITTAPTNRQVKNVLWRYINTAAGRNKDKLLGRPLQMEYQIASDWYALGFKGSNENTDAFQGFHAESLLLIVDEAAGVPEQVFDAADAILTGSGASCLLIGNPTSSSGTFRDAFHRDSDLWHGIKISAYDSPNFTYFGITRDDMLSGAWRDKIGDSPMPYPALIDPAWVARQLRRHGHDSAFVVSRIDADFPDDAGDTLIPLRAIESIDEVDSDTQPAPGTRFEVGIDVARYGDDETSVAIRQGAVYMGQESWGKTDLMTTVGRIQHVVHEDYGLSRDDVILKVDVIGMGAGVYDRLVELGYTCEAVNVAAKSSDREKWPNLRHDLWDQLYERIVNGRIVFAPGVSFDEVAVGQMSDIHFSYRSGYTGRIIETKDEAKKRGVRSPDRAEAIMLAYATLPQEEGPKGYVGIGSARGRW